MTKIKTKNVSGFNDKTLANLAETAKIEGLPEKLIKMREDLNSGFSQEMVDEGIQKRINDGTIANMTIKNNSITLDKLSFTKCSKNLFNKNTVIADTVLLGATTGATQTMSDNTCSDYIKIKPNTNYKANNVINYAFYDTNKTYISGVNSYGGVMASPSNAKYLRISFNTSKVDINTFQIEEGDSSSEYEEYKVILDPECIKLTDSYINEIYKGYNVDSESIKNNSITLDKLSFTKCSKNLFNKNTVIADTVLLGATTGATQTMSNNTCSDYIKIKSNTNYKANNNVNYAFYDTNKTYISGVNSYGGVMASPSNAKYLRISFNTSKVDINTFQIEEGDSSSEYEEYKVILDPECIKLTDSYINEIYKGYNVDGKSIIERKNLYNKNDVNNKDNYMIDPRYGTLSASSGDTAHSASDYIKVEPNTTYVINVNANIAFYNSNKGYVGRAYDSSHSDAATVPAGTPFTTTEDTAYVRFSIREYTKYKDTCQLEKGNTTTDYTEYGIYKINNALLPKNENDKKGTGLKLVTYGDSITAQNKWQPHVKAALGFNTIVNLGKGGTHVGGSSNVAFCNPTRIATIPTDADVITIMGGTNDCGAANATGRAIGDMSYPFNTETFKGALASTITQIQERVPNAIIIIMSPVGGRGNEGGVNMTAPVYNKSGLTTEDYAIACKEVAHSLSIPFIDVFGESGINQFNRAMYIMDTVHPNDAGGEKMSKVIINGMNRIL